MAWEEINDKDLAIWQAKLFACGSSMFQFPIWVSAFRSISFFKPHFLKYTENDTTWGYCGVVEVNFVFIKGGLVANGPVIFADSEEKKDRILTELISYIQLNGLSFIRFSGDICAQIKTIGQYAVTEKNTFPFYKDILHHFLVYKKADADALKNSFNDSTRNTINKTIRQPVYNFITDDTGQYLDRVYDLFIQTGKTKGFTYRPKSSYQALFNDKTNFATLYLAFLGEQIVNAILVIRDKDRSLNMSGALDVSATKKHYSPAKYLHYYAMCNEFFNYGTKSYDMCYSDGAVGEFKRNFHPEHTTTAEPVSIIFDKRRFRLYETILIKYNGGLKKIARKGIALLKA